VIPSGLVAPVEKWLVRHSTRYQLRYFNRRLVDRARERDAQMNAETSPPDGEVVAWRGVWIAEAFTLSMFPHLAEGVERLRPRRGSFDASRFEDAIAALRDIAAMQRGGHVWWPIGMVAPGGGNLNVEPPEGVERVELWLHAPLPSVVLLVAGFRFDEERALAPTSVLTREWVTEMHPTDGLLYPEFRKAREIRKLRFQTKRICCDWLAKTLGIEGVFATGDLESSRYPATEWWTTRRAMPFDRSGSAHDPKYMFVARLTWPLDTWTSEELGGQRLTWADSDEISSAGREPSYSLVLAGREDDIFAGDDLKAYGENPDAARFNRLGVDVSAVTALWAIVCLMRAYERQLATVRESLQALQRRKLRKSLRRFEAVEEHRITAEGDLVPLLRDLTKGGAALEEATRFYSGLEIVPTSTPAPSAPAKRRWRRRTPPVPPPPESWVRRQARELAARAERLLEREETFRQLSDSVATSLNTRSNLKLQRGVFWLTWLLVAIAIATLTVTLLLERWRSSNDQPSRVRSEHVAPLLGRATARTLVSSARG
jgi:hypothetical protein